MGGTVKLRLAVENIRRVAATERSEVDGRFYFNIQSPKSVERKRHDTAKRLNNGSPAYSEAKPEETKHPYTYDPEGVEY